MPEAPQTLVNCDSCGKPMKLVGIVPFTHVICPGCGAKSRVMREFGPYTLTRRHAVGGMSMVFAAHDATLDREVALKVLSEEYSADERRISAFEEEARITASFSHPNVVRVLTTGRAFGRFYIAMELVPGGHFEHQIRVRGRIPELEMLPLAIEVAEGLKAAHGAGLIHRDIKPGNILLDAEGHARIVDFGLALVTQGGKAKAEELWATPYYVPPETIEGAPEDFRSDIYAFGATLYHALAGVPSCGEETMATDILREAKLRVVPLATREPGLSVHTCRIVDRAMAYRPEDRYPSYDELIRDLNSSLKRLQTGTAMSVGQEEVRTRRWNRNKRREQGMIGLAGITMLVAVGAGVWWVSHKPPEKPAMPLVADGIPATEPAGMGGVDATGIAKRYREARAAVERGDYTEAGVGFAGLLADPSVQEPTRSWAGAEAVVAAFLEADVDSALKRAAAAAAHMRSLGERSPGDRLLETLERLSALGGIAAGEMDSANPDAGAVLAWMVAGLKDWDQGLASEAALLFGKVAGAELGSEGGWLGLYQKIAGDYLSDHRLLAGPLFTTLPADPAACERAVAELEGTLNALKSRGRASFNVRAWQLDLKRRAKLLANPAAEEATAKPGWEEPAVLTRLRELAEGGRFPEARAYLEALDGAPEAERDALLAVCGAAGQFFGDLQADLVREPVAGDFTLRSGAVVRGIAQGEDGALSATLDGGGTRILAWADLSADSLIRIHRSLVKNPMPDEVRSQRHEHAIAYDWLAGSRERAVAAANLLAQTDAEFKVRWEALAPALPKGSE